VPLAKCPKLSQAKTLDIARLNGLDRKISILNVGEKSACDQGISPLNVGGISSGFQMELQQVNS